MFIDSAKAPELKRMLPRIGPQPPPLHFRCRSVEEAPEVPDQLPAATEDDFASDETAPCQAITTGVPPRLEVAGSWGEGAYPALSPRSGRMKRKDGDHLRLNGEYVLLPLLHNGAPCWEKPADNDCKEARVIFRAADGRSWVIDEELHEGDADDLVISRKWTTSADVTEVSSQLWMPVPLCMHAAGVHCNCSCFQDALIAGTAGTMFNCC